MSQAVQWSLCGHLHGQRQWLDDGHQPHPQVSPPAARRAASRRGTSSPARKRKRSRSADHRQPSPRPVNGHTHPRAGSSRPADRSEVDDRLPADETKSAQRSSDVTANGRRQSGGGSAPRSRSRQPQRRSPASPRRRTPSPRRRMRSEPRDSADSVAADVQRLTKDTGVLHAMKCVCNAHSHDGCAHVHESLRAPLR